MAIKTVLGDVELGPGDGVLPHEHLVIDYRQKDGGSPPVSRAIEERSVRVLSSLPSVGMRMIVDCTPPGYGRDISFLRRVSERSGVHIVASTGTFCEAYSPLPRWVTSSDVDALADIFVAELERDCGAIKVATSATATPAETLALRAASRAQRRSGAPIVSHTTGGYGLEQLDIFEEEGAELSRVLVSHVCAEDEPAEYAAAIASRGAFVGFDRIGHAATPTAHWFALIRQLEAEGFADRLLLSHDSVQQFTGPPAVSGHTVLDIDLIPLSFRNESAEHGISPALYQQITVTNPASWLAPNRDAQ